MSKKVAGRTSKRNDEGCGDYFVGVSQQNPSPGNSTTVDLPLGLGVYTVSKGMSSDDLIKQMIEENPYLDPCFYTYATFVYPNVPFGEPTACTVGITILKPGNGREPFEYYKREFMISTNFTVRDAFSALIHDYPGSSTVIVGYTVMPTLLPA